MAGKRRFGGVRRLSSGRFQARYLGPDGMDRPAPDTFSSKTAAEVWLTRKEVEIRDGEWIDPDLGKVAFTMYADGWVRDRMLKLRTEELYRGLLRNHLLPFSATGLSGTYASLRSGDGLFPPRDRAGIALAPGAVRGPGG